jgi:hypothetical protein
LTRDVITFCRSLGDFCARPQIDEVLQAMVGAGDLEAHDVAWSGGDGFLQPMRLRMYRMAAM